MIRLDRYFSLWAGAAASPFGMIRSHSANAYPAKLRRTLGITPCGRNRRPVSPPGRPAFHRSLSTKIKLFYDIRKPCRGRKRKAAVSLSPSKPLPAKKSGLSNGRSLPPTYCIFSDLKKVAPARNSRSVPIKFEIYKHALRITLA